MTITIVHTMNSHNFLPLDIPIKLLSPNANMPSQAHKGDAGWDVYADHALTLEPMERAALGTGIALGIPLGWEAQLRGRSGLALHHGIWVHVGTIDSSYRKEIKVILINLGQEPYAIKQGDRVAQLVFQPTYPVVLTPGAIQEHSRGGFGSSGR